MANLLLNRLRTSRDGWGLSEASPGSVLISGLLGQSLAINRQSRCGLVRGWPVASSHFSPGLAPQVGQWLASTCFALSSFFMAKKIMPQHRCTRMVNFEQVVGIVRCLGFSEGSGQTLRQVLDVACFMNGLPLLICLAAFKLYGFMTEGANHKRRGRVCHGHFDGLASITGRYRIANPKSASLACWAFRDLARPSTQSSTQC